jgi:hypothetical protein
MVDSAVKAQARRAAPRSLTRLAATSPSTWWVAADRVPPWFGFMSPFWVGFCPDACSALLGRARAISSSRTVPRSLRAS